jgi:hypothetical protein
MRGVADLCCFGAGAPLSSVYRLVRGNANARQAFLARLVGAFEQQAFRASSPALQRSRTSPSGSDEVRACAGSHEEHAVVR